MENKLADKEYCINLYENRIKALKDKFKIYRLMRVKQGRRNIILKQK